MCKWLVDARSRATLLLLLGSVALSSCVGMLALASHTPFRTSQPILAALIASRLPASNKSWSSVHILAAEGCACSSRIADYLIGRGALPGLYENVILIGRNTNWQRRLDRKGFSVVSLSAQEASERFQIHGVPWLVFLSPAGTIQYAGGYTSQRGLTSSYQDVAIWQALQKGSVAPALPAFGCAVGERLQRQIDPLGLKYHSNNRVLKTYDQL